MELYFDETNKIVKRGTKKWGENKTLYFIRMYRSHPCLWDTSLEDYRNKEAREVAYRDLQNRFGLSLLEVRNKIKSLRTTYNLELRKYKDPKKSDSNCGKKFESSLIWFKDMHAMFMGSNDGQQSGSNFISEVKDIPPDSSFGDILPQFNELGYDNNLLVHRPPKKEWKEEEQEEEEVYDPAAATKEESVPHNLEDEFELFGRHVAGQLREMNIVRALRGMTKIQVLLYKERMEELQVSDVSEDFLL